MREKSPRATRPTPFADCAMRPRFVEDFVGNLWSKIFFVQFQDCRRNPYMDQRLLDPLPCVHGKGVGECELRAYCN
eukprot:5377351-Pyramimonas_sp.AAC.1